MNAKPPAYGDNGPERYREIDSLVDKTVWPFVPSGYESDTTRANRELVAAHRLTMAHAAQLIRERGGLDPTTPRPQTLPGALRRAKVPPL